MHASPPRCTSWPRSAPSRASAPAASSRSRSRSSATSCRRGSGPSTRATSSPSSAPPASSARSSAASSPGRRRILGIAGWRWVFLVNVPIGIAALVVVARTLHLPHTRRDHRIDWLGRRGADRRPGPAAASSPSRAASGAGAPAARSPATSSACVGVVAVPPRRAADGRRGAAAAAAVPQPHLRRRPRSPRSHRRHGHVRRHRLPCRSTCRSSRAPRPTAAGLLLLPMILGIMGGSIVSGQIISRTGRYRHFPIIGSALLVIALFGFHYIGADTPLWRTMILMVVFGVGLGFNMQPLTLAVQNAVAAAGHGRGHLLGDVHPPDRRHPRHRGLPVDPLLGRAGQDRDGLPDGRPDPGLPGGAEGPPGQRRGQRTPSSRGCSRRGPAAAAARSTAR